LGERVLAEITRLNLFPTPEHYRLWYTALNGGNTALSQELQRMEAQKISFTPDVTSYLYNKYFPAPDAEGAAGVEEAKEILGTVMKLVAEFSGDTVAYNQKIDQHALKLVKTADGAATKSGAVGGLLQEIVTQLQEIKSTGTNFSEKLDSSREEIESLRKNLEKATAESRRDFLTGIPNRRAFDETISGHAETCEKQLKDLCLLMIDIDHFKKFNDTWGHQTGDEVLKVVAKALSANIRGSDMVARFGGEEFAVMLPGTPINGALVVAENIRKTIANSKLKRKESQADLGQITVSIGVARYRLGEEDTIPFLIKRADEALYSAKRAGRNRVSAEL
jgi:diguanylate cyclase